MTAGRPRRTNWYRLVFARGVDRATRSRALKIVLGVELVGGAAVVAANVALGGLESTRSLIALGIGVVLFVAVLAYAHRRVRGA